MRWVICFAALILVVNYSSAVQCETGKVERPIMIVKADNELSSDTITFADIATFKNESMDRNQIVSRIKQIIVAESVQPGSVVELIGEDLLSKIRSSSIDPEQLAYSVPRVVRVAINGVVVPRIEIEQAVSGALQVRFGNNVSLVGVQGHEGGVFTQKGYKVVAVVSGDCMSGRVPMTVSVVNADGRSDGSNKRLEFTAIIDDWREVPVAKRLIERGKIISDDDLAVARVNLRDRATNTLLEGGEIVGRRATSRIRAGTPFQENNIDTPPDVSKGAKVSLVYTKGPLSASTVAVAQEDGNLGEVITVQNTTSRKFIKGSVKGPGELTVVDYANGQ